VMTGGEIAAIAVVDAVARLVPGVLGNDTSSHDESFSAGLLEYPHYTRPPVWEGHAVPDVLLSGNHQRIAAWRAEQSRRMTEARRPELWARWIEQNPPSPPREKRSRRRSVPPDGVADRPPEVDEDPTDR
jgi:tRNA (guanine37-N1)-methyltransferase